MQREAPGPASTAVALIRADRYAGCGPVTVLFGVVGAGWAGLQLVEALRSALEAGMVAIPVLNRARGRGIFPVEMVPWAWAAPYMAWLVFVLWVCLALALPRVGLLGRWHPFMALVTAVIVSPVALLFCRQGTAAVAFFVILGAALLALVLLARKRRR